MKRIMPFLLIILPITSAFGVSSPYWKENPLILSPGELKEVKIELQNMIGENEIKLRAKLISGKEIAKIININKVYTIPSHTKNYNIYIKIKIPENAKDNEKYNISLEFNNILKKGKEVISLSQNIKKTFPVIVKTSNNIKEKTLKESLTFYLIIFTLIIIITIIIFKIRKNKKFNAKMRYENLGF